jgi:GNAT superfamily N-acetyltransferase
MLEDYGRVIGQHPVMVAEVQGELAGFLVLDETPEGFRLMNVAVDPRYQNTGVGRALLAFAEQEARRRSHASIYLSTHEKMTENQRHYAKIGYREYLRQVEADGHCRVYMRKSLT